jgi:hypothetical protein
MSYIEIYLKEDDNISALHVITYLNDITEMYSLEFGPVQLVMKLDVISLPYSKFILQNDQDIKKYLEKGWETK